ncbi:hypothetical protein ACFL2Q_07860 [Thermodesulfobacteriota bacterium]
MRSDHSFRKSLILTVICLTVLLAVFVTPAYLAPIQRIEGVITNVGEGFIMLQPEGETTKRKFILRWKARFVPPKLPLEGDRVLILYKDKPDGAIIYGVEYLSSRASSLVPERDSSTENVGK